MRNGGLKQFIENFKDIIWVASIAIALVLYIISTFATQSALAEKEVEIKSYVDQKHNSVEKRLDGIESVLERVDQRVYELHKRK